MNQLREEGTPTYASTVIELQRLSMSWRIYGDVDLTVERDVERDEIVYRLERLVPSQELLSERVRIERSIPFPKTAWDMIKLQQRNRWWMRWWVKRHPIQYHSYDWSAWATFKRYALFPESTLQVKELGKSLIWEKVNVEFDGDEV
jgi:hypothetical protein